MGETRAIARAARGRAHRRRHRRLACGTRGPRVPGPGLGQGDVRHRHLGDGTALGSGTRSPAVGDGRVVRRRDATGQHRRRPRARGQHRRDGRRHRVGRQHHRPRGEGGGGRDPRRVRARRGRRVSRARVRGSRRPALGCRRTRPGVRAHAGAPRQGHLARAAFDAVAYQVRDVLEVLEPAVGAPLTALFADGGAIQSELLARITADTTGLPVVRSRADSLAALGAAYLAGLAVGCWSSLDEVRALPPSHGSIEPGAARHGGGRLRGLAAGARTGSRAGWPPDVARIDELRLMTRVARLYHESGVKQPEIAARLRLSQPKVSRLLRQAQEEGIVRISVRAPTGTHPDLEVALEDSVTGSRTPRSWMSARDEPDRITPGAGRRGGVPPRADGPLGRRHRRVIVERDAARDGGRHAPGARPRRRARRPDPGRWRRPGRRGSRDAPGASAGQPPAAPRRRSCRRPARVSSAQARRVLLDGAVRAPRDGAVRAARRSRSWASAARSRRGSWRARGNVFSAAELATVRDAGGVGDIGLRYLAADGRARGHATGHAGHRHRAGAAPPGAPRDRRGRRSVARSRPIRAALLGGWVNCLITDRFTAERLLEAGRDRPEPGVRHERGARYHRPGRSPAWRRRAVRGPSRWSASGSRSCPPRRMPPHRSGSTRWRTSMASGTTPGPPSPIRPCPSRTCSRASRRTPTMARPPRVDLTPVAQELGLITTGEAHVYRVHADGTVTDVDTETSRGTIGPPGGRLRRADQGAGLCRPRHPQRRIVHPRRRGLHRVRRLQGPDRVRQGRRRRSTSGSSRASRPRAWRASRPRRCWASP